MLAIWLHVAFQSRSSFAKGNRFSLFFGDPFFWDPFVLFFCFFLSPAKVGSLEMQPGAKLQAYLGVIILQPHASTQRFRLRILRRTRSFPGRTSARSLSDRIESIWETPSKESPLISFGRMIRQGWNLQRGDGQELWLVAVATSHPLSLPWLQIAECGKTPSAHILALLYVRHLTFKFQHLRLQAHLHGQSSLLK